MSASPQKDPTYTVRVATKTTWQKEDLASNFPKWKPIKAHTKKKTIVKSKPVKKLQPKPTRKSKTELQKTKDRMWRAARYRANLKGIVFDIVPDDITIPETCPVFGLPLVSGVGAMHEFSPSLDRIYSNLGYTPDNIIVVSQKANRIKSGSSLQDMETVLQFYKTLETKPQQPFTLHTITDLLTTSTVR